MLRDFFAEYEPNGKPWIICGKGPSFRAPTEDEREKYNVIGLNHVSREIPVEIAHVIDVDVINQLGESLYTNAKAVLMPYHPHVGWRPNALITLDDICKSHTVLSRMCEEGRVFAYNLSTTRMRESPSPVVEARYFSAEAAVSLLGLLGVKEIRTLGIDGGASQSLSFSDLTNFNKERGYDIQWKGIRRSINRYHLLFGPLGLELPIRVFIGAGPQQIVPAEVLKHSILKHATATVDVTIMSNWTHPMPRDARNQPRTPFSFQRFMIPERCNYQGHALYLDSDMLVFGDINEIWCKSKQPVLVMRNDDIDEHKAKYSVMDLDCSQLEWNIEEIVRRLDCHAFDYEDLVFNLFTGDGQGFDDGFDPNWNSLEEYIHGQTKLLHYTVMRSQPWWADAAHPLAHLWFSELVELNKERGDFSKVVEEHVGKGWLLPRCLEVLNA